MTGFYQPQAIEEKKAVCENAGCPQYCHLLELLSTDAKGFSIGKEHQRKHEQQSGDVTQRRSSKRSKNMGDHFGGDEGPTPHDGHQDQFDIYHSAKVIIEQVQLTIA